MIKIQKLGLLRNLGFTLIELIVAFSIIAILSTVGIASFVSYSRTQAVNTEASNIVSVLNLARAKTQSQVNPCEDSETLVGYQLKVVNDTNYQLEYVCMSGGANVSSPINKYKLANPIKLSSSQTVFLFKVLSGGNTTGTLTVTGNWTPEIERTITLDQNGIH